MLPVADLTDANVLFLVEVVHCNDGISSYIETLATGLKARGINIHLVSGEVDSDANSEAKRERISAALAKWHVFPHIGKLPSPSGLRLVYRIIRENSISVINVHGLGMLMWGKLLGLATGARVVATYHPSVLGNLQKVKTAPKADFNVKQIAFLNVFLPQKLVVLSEETRRQLGRYVYFRRGRLEIIYGAVDTMHFHPPSAQERLRAREEFGLAKEEFACLLVGRLAWNKGHDLLIEAARKLRGRRQDLAPRLRCLFVGSGGREEQMKSFAYGGDERDKETFRFFGFVPEVREALWAADLFVLPSRFEGFALGVAEAMATGLVPVRTPSGGASDQIIEGKTGIIVPFEDIDALSQAIERLTDGTLRETMAGNCVARAREFFGVGSMVERTLGVYGFSQT